MLILIQLRFSESQTWERYIAPQVRRFRNISISIAGCPFMRTRI